MADVALMTNPMTTTQDIIVGGASGAPARLAAGSEGEVLTVGAGGILEWAAPGGGGGAPDDIVENYRHESEGYGAGTGTDEFDNDSFSGWTAIGTGLVSGDVTESAAIHGYARMVIPSGRNATQIFYKTGYTGGDFTLRSKVGVNFATKSDTSMWGIQITDSSGNGVGASFHGASGSTTSALYLRNVAAHADSSGLTSGAADWSDYKTGKWVYLELVKASGVYTARFSPNGLNWTEVSGTPSAFTVARIAFGRTFHAGTATQTAVFDYVRSSA